MTAGERSLRRNYAVAKFIAASVPDIAERYLFADMLGLVDGDQLAADDMRPIKLEPVMGQTSAKNLSVVDRREVRSTAPAGLWAPSPSEAEPEPEPAPAPPVVEAVKKRPGPQRSAKCGTEGGKRQHRINGEKCATCRVGFGRGRYSQAPKEMTA